MSVIREVSAEFADALVQRRLVPRDFLSIWARDRDDDQEVFDGQWSGIGTVSAALVDPDSGETVNRTFTGVGTLISIGAISMVSNLTVRTVSIRMVGPGVADQVKTLLQTHDAQQARVQIHRGLFDPTTGLSVAPAECRFVGFINTLKITTAAEGGDESNVELECVSHSQELTRSNPDTRSHESQKRRSATDNFFQDAGVVGSWYFSWGKKQGRRGATTRGSR